MHCIEIFRCVHTASATYLSDSTMALTLTGYDSGGIENKQQKFKNRKKFIFLLTSKESAAKLLPDKRENYAANQEKRLWCEVHTMRDVHDTGHDTVHDNELANLCFILQSNIV
uniref:Uncharacterized protein n=1 Tax=Glossina pallidipes TaxID=7398 RepID=A0A1A9ZLL5_GLOPL